MRRMVARRRGAVPPIVTIVIVVAATLAAALVAYFLYATTARSARTVILSIVGTPTLYNDTTGSVYVLVTIKNDGTDTVDFTGAKLIIETKSGSVVLSLDSAAPKLAPGESTSLKFSGNAKFEDIPDGALATLQVGKVQVSFAVAKP